MTEPASAVALLFDDGELVGQLREALQERGARIVHEGSLAAFSRPLLDACGAEVLVINLDGDDAGALERLHDLVGAGHPRVVFNDAQASRRLSGWDRDRWARHLAAKVLAHDDVDPPRPEDAPQVLQHVPEAPVESHEAPEPAALQSDVVESAVVGSAVVEPAVVEPAAELETQSVPSVSFEEHLLPELAEHGSTAEPGTAAAESESLAAELEALLAADQHEFEGEEQFGHGLNYDAGAGIALHDGDFVLDEPESAPPQSAPSPVPPPLPASPTPPAAAVAKPSFQLDHLSLMPMDESFEMPKAAPSAPAKFDAVMEASDSWSLVDDDDLQLATADHSVVEVEKLSAEDYFAPLAEHGGESPLEPGLSLELVALEDAIAPQLHRPDHELQLAELGDAFNYVVALGAAVDSEDAVADFLAALPAHFPLPIVLAQHLGDSSVEQLARRLEAHSALPVRLAAHGQRARGGEVLLMPPGALLRLRRDGQFERQGDANAELSPSIDAVFTAIAHSFGRDVRAIVFAGRANDAVAGAQAVHDRGGQVWVELPQDDYFTDMVHGVQAERLVSFSGTPQALAARLTEEFP